MFETRNECWALQIPVERPTIREYVHFFAGGAPVSKAPFNTSEFAAYLTHTKYLKVWEVH
jgi:hypothetical protein